MAVSSCNLNVRALSVAFTLRNASTSIAGSGISALGWSQAGGGLVMKMDQRLLLAKAAHHRWHTEFPAEVITCNS